MDLMLYEPAHPFDPSRAVLDVAAAELWDVSGQAAAWLRKAVLVVLPRPAVRTDRIGDGHD